MIIPVFKLYGEAYDWSEFDGMHCETISIRSQAHNGEIKSHRHADLCQLLYLRKGRALIDIDGDKVTVTGPALQVVPKNTIHGFLFDQGTEGVVLTLSQTWLDEFQGVLGQHCDLLSHPQLLPLDGQLSHVEAIFSAILHEFNGDMLGRHVMQAALLQQLLVQLVRGHPSCTMRTRQKRHRNNAEVLAEFLALVEHHFHERWPIQKYADQLCMTTVHLNHICRQQTGLPPLSLLHQRIMLEAKRQLIYSNDTVNRIANNLGFEESSYFIRFFKRNAGETPYHFREEHHGGKSLTNFRPRLSSLGCNSF
ncbi:helix-turn-helix domain-containing protein [Leeia oryzae]|uniref:helix-turn-helix domain-containing protein n=1 Tax=Leeia oryzae TaxID=356662 RepID=UPI00036263D7|nr:helix-turn-helix domain-containing protein [Leeia oryzae]